MLPRDQALALSELRRGSAGVRLRRALHARIQAERTVYENSPACEEQRQRLSAFKHAYLTLFYTPKEEL